MEQIELNDELISCLLSVVMALNQQIYQMEQIIKKNIKKNDVIVYNLTEDKDTL